MLLVKKYYHLIKAYEKQKKIFEDQREKQYKALETLKSDNER